MNKKYLKAVLFAFVLITAFAMFSKTLEINAAMVPALPNITITSGEGADQTSSALQILFLFVIIALIPTILLMMTSFLRITIVLHFLRQALGTMQIPPNQVMMGIALVMTIFVMNKPLQDIYNEAYIPFQAGEIETGEFGARLVEPLREFMFAQVQREDLGLFGNRLAGLNITTETPEEEIPNTVLIPAFVLSELKWGFQAGFWLYLGFIVIDMVVASVLMAMGMMMLPPAMISMPFKIMIFVMSDGWRLVIQNIVDGFHMIN